MSQFNHRLSGSFEHDSFVVDAFMDYLQDLKTRAFVTTIYSADELSFEEVEAEFQEQSGIGKIYPEGAKTIQFNPIEGVISKVYTRINPANALVSFDDDTEHDVFPIFSKHFTVDTPDGFQLIDFTNVPDFDGGLMLLTLRGARPALPPEAININLNLLATEYANFQYTRLDNNTAVAAFERQSGRIAVSQEVPQVLANPGYFISSLTVMAGIGRNNVTAAGAGLAQYISANALSAAGVAEYGLVFHGYAGNTPQRIDRFHWRTVAGAQGLAKGSRALILGFR